MILLDNWQFQYGVSHFDKDKLKKTETVEKNVLPTAEDIKAEKEADGK